MATGPIDPRLCEDCAGIRLEDLRKGLPRPWKGSILDLRKSSVRCELCALFLKSMATTRHTFHDENLLYMAGGLRLVSLAKHNLDHIWDQDDLIPAVNGPYTRRLVSLDLFSGTKEALRNWDGQTGPTGQLLWKGGGDDASDTHRYIDGRLSKLIAHLDLYYPRESQCQELLSMTEQRAVRAAHHHDNVDTWLSDCRTTHKFCNKVEADIAGQMPKRLLEIMDDSYSIRVIETTDTEYSYIALSHRWGGATMIQTTQANIADHTKGILVGSLNRTFRDAVQTTTKLGFHYLWIDSLCIIQDSASDWTQEASRMAVIYQNATVTLSAACATSGDSGLFHTREQVPEVQMKHCQSGAPQGCEYWLGLGKRPAMEDFATEVESGSLSTRAWCMQERYLSRRTIHFGKGQLFWECQKTCRGQSIDNSIFDMTSTDRYSDEGFLLYLSKCIWPQTPMPLIKTDLADGYDMWYKVVCSYSRRSLTVSADKLPAIPGMASVVASIAKDRYVAGLWERDLAKGLLWHRAGKLLAPPSIRGPSWSWVAWDGEIDMKLCLIGEVVLESINPVVTLKSEDPFGQVGPAYIETTGPIQMVWIGPRIDRGSDETYTRNFGWYHANAEVFNGSVAFIGVAAIDCEAEISVSKAVHALVVFRNGVNFRPFSPTFVAERKDTVWALLLTLNDTKSAFQRVGLGEIRQDSLDTENRSITIL